MSRIALEEYLEMTGRRHKYGNRIVQVDGERFDSLKEYRRYQELKLLEKAGEISDLQRQKTFELQPGFKHAGKKYRPITYIADFVYYDETEDCRHCTDPITRWVVEDVKSEATRKDKVYQIKKKMMLYVQHREIKEV